MAAVIVQYKVKPHQVETNKQLVRAVYDELRENPPGDTRYITFQLEDGVSFIHLNRNDREDGTNALAELPAFQRFQEGIRERVEEGPLVTRLNEVGSFRIDHGKQSNKRRPPVLGNSDEMFPVWRPSTSEPSG